MHLIDSRFLIALLVLIFGLSIKAQTPYRIVDTDQSTCYDTLNEITSPVVGEMFFGQDAQYNGNQPDYTNNGDGTVTDNNTGLMWQKTPDQNGDGEIKYDDKMSYVEALEAADTFSLAGYTDWRLPSIKEQYSLILFSGIDPSGYEGTSTEDLIPFIDTDYFDFGYGDLSADERLIDAQYATSTLYVSSTMMGDETMFGVNFADGRIKGYGIGPLPGQTEGKQFYVTYVRGNDEYGINDFVYNADGTITDNATGLTWMQEDNGEAISWAEALSYAEGFEYAGHSDWRLPNAKELQSVLDYTRSPATTNSAAIDPMFNCSQITDEGGNTNYPFYWTGTTHANWTDTPGNAAAYICFGEALGWMEMPPNSGNYQLLDVHGAGSQRSDFKSGDPENYPYGNGPQGDVIRIYNHVRLVRGGAASMNIDDQNSMGKFELRIGSNPARDQVFVNSNVEIETINLWNTIGKNVLQTSVNGNSCSINLKNYEEGLYFLEIKTRNKTVLKKLMVKQ